MTVPPGFELLVLCARAARPDPDLSSAIAERAGRVSDWDTVLRAAVAHAVTPALYQGLVGSGAISALPPATAERLGLLRRHGVERALRMTGELVRIVDALLGQGLRVAAFKGPALSALLYGDIAMRESVDLDILVHPEDLARAAEWMRRDGFRTVLGLSERELARLPSYGNEIAFRDASGLVVELEWAMAPRYLSIPLRLSEVLRRTQAVRVGGAMLPTPDPDDLLLLLCVHGGKHLWERLGWIRDIGVLLERSPTVASLVLSRADEAHVRRMLLVGLWLADLVLGVAPPEGFRGAMAADPCSRELALELRSRMARRIPDARRSDPLLHRLHLQLRERRRDRASHVARLATTPTLEDWRASHLPEALSFGAYAVRPFRLLAKYGLGR